MKPGADIADTVNGQKERPIIFSAPMVRAILDGRKTQTRRIITKQPTGSQYYIQENDTFRNGNPNAGVERKGGQWAFYRKPTGFWGVHFSCPYGSVGDRLWVREAWWPSAEAYDTHDTTDITYRADHLSETKWRWRPSIHMPRWASRITLEITKVRVERLQEIREEDACQEGVSSGDGKDFQFAVTRKEAIPLFRKLWDSINGKGAWDANPWVWVLEFKRVLCGNVTESDSATGVSSPKSSFGAGQH